MVVRFSAPVQTGPGAHPASCTMGTGSFSGVKSGRGVTLTTRPLLVPWSSKGRAIPLLPLWAVQPVQSLSACTRVHFTVLAFIQINVSLVPILLVLLLLCISSTNARIMEHTKWVCLRPTVRMLLSSTKESDKWWLYRNSATPTNAQFYSLCMISLVHVLSLSPSSQSLHQNVIKTYILFFFVV